MSSLLPNDDNPASGAGGASDSIQDDAINNFGGLTPGRIVHYVLESHEHRAAIILSVAPDRSGDVNLLALCDPSIDQRTGVFEMVEQCPYDRDHQPMTWHWIEGSFTDLSHQALLERLRHVKSR